MDDFFVSNKWVSPKKKKKQLRGTEGEAGQVHLQRGSQRALIRGGVSHCLSEIRVGLRSGASAKAMGYTHPKALGDSQWSPRAQAVWVQKGDRGSDLGRRVPGFSPREVGRNDGTWLRLLRHHSHLFVENRR